MIGYRNVTAAVIGCRDASADDQRLPVLDSPRQPKPVQGEEILRAEHDLQEGQWYPCWTVYVLRKNDIWEDFCSEVLVRIGKFYNSTIINFQFTV